MRAPVSRKQLQTPTSWSERERDGVGDEGRGGEGGIGGVGGGGVQTPMWGPRVRGPRGQAYGLQAQQQQSQQVPQQGQQAAAERGPFLPRRRGAQTANKGLRPTPGGAAAGAAGSTATGGGDGAGEEEPTYCVCGQVGRNGLQAFGSFALQLSFLVL